MTKAKVYFSDMRTRYGGLSLPQKLGKLIEAAGSEILIFRINLRRSRSTSANRAIFLFCAQIMPK